MRHLWVYKDTLRSIKETGEYCAGERDIPNDHIFYGTEDELGQLIADFRQWVKFSEGFVQPRKMVKKGITN